MRQIKPLRLIFAAMALALVGSAAAQTGNVPQASAPANCPDGQPADGKSRVGNARHCLFMRQIDPANANPNVLAVFLHGDNSGRTELRMDRGAAYSLADKLRVSTVALQRPGYQSELGRSDGFNQNKDDDYTEGNVEIVASALAHLRQLHPGKKLLLIGHSGGSAMTALVAARFATSADAYLVAACPCDIGPWRAWRQSSAGRGGHWPNSLSPLAEVSKIPAATRIALIVGSKDDNTLPKFSEAFVASLQAQGVKTRLTYAVDATHNSVLRAPEFFMLASDLVAELLATSR